MEATFLDKVSMEFFGSTNSAVYTKKTNISCEELHKLNSTGETQPFPDSRLPTSGLCILPWRPSTYSTLKSGGEESQEEGPGEEQTKGKSKETSGKDPTVQHAQPVRPHCSQPCVSTALPPVAAACPCSMHAQCHRKPPHHPATTECGWCSHTAELDKCVGQFGERSAALRGNSFKTASELDFCAPQVKSTNVLANRLDCEKTRKHDVNCALDALLAAQDMLCQLRRRGSKLLCETNNPLCYVQSMLCQRQKRQGIDLVCDKVGRELNCEAQCIRNAQEELKSVLCEAEKVLCCTQTLICELETSRLHRYTAINLDSRALRLQNHSVGVTHHPCIENYSITVNSGAGWCAYTSDLLKRAEKQRCFVEELIKNMHLKFSSLYACMLEKWEFVNGAITDRVKQLIESKCNVQDKLKEVLQELHCLEKNIDFLKYTISHENDSLKVVESRLALRNCRPGSENVLDCAQERLLTEVRELKCAISRLCSLLRESEHTRVCTLKTKVALETELAVRSETLFIDRDKVLANHRMLPVNRHDKFPLLSCNPAGPGAGCYK